MGSKTGFLEINRSEPSYRNPSERINDYKEFYEPFSVEKTQEQGARCMDCGVPFCHSGCPLGNIIPDFNDAVYKGDWEEAYNILNSTNNFPEFTGRICPAPCESSCVLGINKPPVTIEHIEKTIIETAFKNGYVKPNPPEVRTGKKVAVVGSGPAGLAAAMQLNTAGYWVTVFERDDRLGGLLRYGIPDFKLEKWTIDRRLEIMEKEGVTFQTKANIGENVSVDDLKSEYDAILLAGGSTIPRPIPISGNELDGVYFAMDFLTQQNKVVAGEKINDQIMATGKNVVVIGGGDTGSDCVGTSNRHKAKSVTQIEIMPRPPKDRSSNNPWPEWPMTLRTSSSHQEGCERDWSVLTKAFIGNDKGELTGLKIIKIEWTGKTFKEIEGSEVIIPCELALIAAGFVHPQKEGMIEKLGIELDECGNVKANNYQTNVPSIFTAGDMRRGQSLVVWAISEGREAARAMDEYLMEASSSPLLSKSKSMLELDMV
ncbi:MAG TPA: glutamate synthase subunit beta [Cyclobacteriaceae bacterium]